MNATETLFQLRSPVQTQIWSRRSSMWLMAILFAFVFSGCEKPPDSPEASAKWKKAYEEVVKNTDQSARKSSDMLTSHLGVVTPDTEIYDSLLKEARERDLYPLGYARVSDLLKRRPGDIELQALIARILQREGFLAESEQYVSHQLSLKPNDSQLLSELLRTHIVAFSLDKAHELLRTTDPPQNSSAYNAYASLIYEVNGDRQGAFDSLFLSLKDDSYSLGSNRFRNLARISRQLGRPLMARYFYALYRFNASPKDVQEIYDGVQVDEDYSIERASLVVSLRETKTINYQFQMSIAVRRPVSELYIPVLIPSGTSDATHSEVQIVPTRGFRLVQNSAGKTRIHQLVFEKPLAQATEVTVVIEFDQQVDCPSTCAWISQKMAVLHPYRLYLEAGSGFAVATSSMVRKNRNADCSIKIRNTIFGLEVHPTLPRMVFRPTVSFAQESALEFLANKFVVIAVFSTVVAFFAALLLHYKARRGVGWALFVFTAACTAAFFFEVIPISLLPDVPGLLLGRAVSPDQQFPQQILAAVLGLIVVVLACFCTWLMALHQDDFTVSGERIALVYFPTIMPLGAAATVCFAAVQLIISDIGWRLQTYVFAFDGVVLLACCFLLLRQYLGRITWADVFGIAVCLVVAACVDRDSTLHLVLRVIYGLFVAALLVGIWLQYRRIRGKFPSAISDSESLLDRLQFSVANLLDKYQTLVRVGVVISGIVTLLSALIAILGTRG